MTWVVAHEHCAALTSCIAPRNVLRPCLLFFEQGEWVMAMGMTSSCLALEEGEPGAMACGWMPPCKTPGQATCQQLHLMAHVLSAGKDTLTRSTCAASPGMTPSRVPSAGSRCAQVQICAPCRILARTLVHGMAVPEHEGPSRGLHHLLLAPL